MSAPRSKLAAAGLLVALAACGGQTQRAREAKAQAIVLVQSNVRDAQLFVDGRFITTLDTARGGIGLTPGVHRFELRHDEFFSSYLEVTLARAERKKVSMAMAPILP